MNTAHRNRVRLSHFILSLLFIISAIPPAFAPPSRPEIPLLFCQEKFNAAILAEAVNHYITIGEVASMRDFAALDAFGQIASSRKYIHCDIDERIGWLCRILFQPKEPSLVPVQGVIFPPPHWLSPPERPLYPVIDSGSSYFILGEAQTANGSSIVPLSETGILDEYQSHGQFRQTLVVVPTRARALSDLALLRKTHSWRTIPWPNIVDERYVWKYMKMQATHIPERKAVSPVRSARVPGSQLPGRHGSGL